MSAVLTPTLPAKPRRSEHFGGDSPLKVPTVLREPPVADEAMARRALRAQIARLEQELASLTCSLVPEPGGFVASLRRSVRAPAPTGAPSPRLLSLGELERQRDELAERLGQERRANETRGLRQEGFRRLREETLLDPAAHPYVRVSNADVGEPGCHDWHVRPRFGLLGMLMSWWRVKISSGCP